MRWQLRDIIDRKKAEAALSQLQAENLELLEADRLRAQLLATVSHELKTPMNAILGFSQVLMAQFEPKHDLNSTEMVQLIFHNEARSTVKGIGLGLAIVHTLFKVMQGTITVDGELGRSSQFSIELPQSFAPTHPPADERSLVAHRH